MPKADRWEGVWGEGGGGGDAEEERAMSSISHNPKGLSSMQAQAAGMLHLDRHHVTRDSTWALHQEAYQQDIWSQAGAGAPFDILDSIESNQVTE